MPLPRHRGGAVIVEIRDSTHRCRPLWYDVFSKYLFGSESSPTSVPLRDLSRLRGGVSASGGGVDGRADERAVGGGQGGNGVSVVKLGYGTMMVSPSRTGTVGFEGDVRCDPRGLRRFKGRAAPPSINPGIGRGRAGRRSGAVGGARGVRGAARARPRGRFGRPRGSLRARARPRVPATSRKKSHAREGTRGARGTGGGRARGRTTRPSRICVSVDAERDAAGKPRAPPRDARPRDGASPSSPRVQQSRRSGGARGTDKPPGGNESRQRDLTSVAAK